MSVCSWRGGGPTLQITRVPHAGGSRVDDTRGISLRGGAPERPGKDPVAPVEQRAIRLAIFRSHTSPVIAAIGAHGVEEKTPACRSVTKVLAAHWIARHGGKEVRDEVTEALREASGCLTAMFKGQGGFGSEWACEEGRSRSCAGQPRRASLAQESFSGRVRLKMVRPGVVSGSRAK